MIGSVVEWHAEYRGVLEQASGGVFPALNPPAPDEAIARVGEELGHELPARLAELLRFADGGKGIFGDDYVWRAGVPSDAHDGIVVKSRDMQEFIRLAIAPIQPPYLPSGQQIAFSTGSNAYSMIETVGPRTGSIVTQFHDADPQVGIVAPDLDTYLELRLEMARRGWRKLYHRPDGSWDVGGGLYQYNLEEIRPVFERLGCDTAIMTETWLHPPQ